MNMFKKVGLGLGAASAFVGANAMAAIDTAAVQTALDSAQASGETVGSSVIAIVAALAVVGVIIALVRKV